MSYPTLADWTDDDRSIVDDITAYLGLAGGTTSHRTELNGSGGALWPGVVGLAWIVPWPQPAGTMCHTRNQTDVHTCDS